MMILKFRVSYCSNHRRSNYIPHSILYYIIDQDSLVISTRITRTIHQLSYEEEKLIIQEIEIYKQYMKILLISIDFF